MESNININKLETIDNKLNIVDNDIKQLISLINKLNLEKKVLLSSAVTECIILYSISNDPFIDKLKLEDNINVIRCLKCNVNFKNKYLKRKDPNLNNILIYREYKVSNSRIISSCINEKLQHNNKLDINFYYGNFIIDKKDINEFITQYDQIINEFKSNTYSNERKIQSLKHE